MVSSFAMLSFWSGLIVQSSKGYNSGSNWSFHQILPDSERCIFPLLLHPYGNLPFGAIAARGSEYGHLRHEYKRGCILRVTFLATSLGG